MGRGYGYGLNFQYYSIGIESPPLSTAASGNLGIELYTFRCRDLFNHETITLLN